MFNYTVVAHREGRRPTLAALTDFADIAQLIQDHAAELDPEGGLRFEIQQCADAKRLIYRREAANE